MDGEIFHILNRGVEKRNIFLDREDYERFAHNLSDFNDRDEASASFMTRRSDNSAMRKPKEQLVNILAWCMMPNHYHILVQEKIDGGAGTFAKKIGSGYTQYFNLKRKRSGVLFQGRSKIIPAQNEEHFLFLPFYILSNPIKLIEPDWKERGIKNKKKVLDFLKNYEWSSGADLLGGSSFPVVVDLEAFSELFDYGAGQFEREFGFWLDNSAIA